MKLRFNNLDISDITVISRKFIHEHMKNVNGDYVKVYLYLCAHADEDFYVENVAEALELTERDVLRALRHWKKEALIFEEEENISEKAGNSVEEGNSAEEVSELIFVGKDTLLSSDRIEIDLVSLEEDKEFKDLVYCAQKYLGKTFTSTDTRKMAYMYDVLKLPTELIEYLIEISVQRGKRSMHYIEKVALDWKSKGILTVEEAKKESQFYNDNVYGVMKAFGLTRRSLNSKEQAYIDKWSKNWRFTSDLICEACERTLSATQKQSFQYADTILSNWHEAGADTMEKIKALDASREDKIKTLPLAKKNTDKKIYNKFNNFEQRNDDLDGMVLDKLNQRLKHNI